MLCELSPSVVQCECPKVSSGRCALCLPEIPSYTLGSWQFGGLLNTLVGLPVRCSFNRYKSFFAHSTDIFSIVVVRNNCKERGETLQFVPRADNHRSKPRMHGQTKAERAIGSRLQVTGSWRSLFFRLRLPSYVSFSRRQCPVVVRQSQLRKCRQNLHLIIGADLIRY